ncbi:type III secretion system chaperone [uncultured Methylobacterium sp.]|uniref:type III secretion system chaperone n=1 Tax=uncultured Methylobacterium sp. TaxID=157278 RepID=UPI0035CC90E7
MQDLHQAIAALREVTGLPDLELGPDQHAEVVFGETPVGFVGIGADHVEMVTPLAALPPELDQTRLARLMTANYLGAATGPARLALDPGRRQIVLCERLDLRGLDADGLHARIVDFLGSAAFWNGPEGHEALDGAPLAAELPATEQYLIRG